jgi:putative SbcD/Mre11-related phosphoesterase
VVLEPIPDEPAAVATHTDGRALVIADYHAGIEAVLSHEGVELASRARQRRDRLQALLTETEPDRLVILGDLVHAIGDPWETERSEVTSLLEMLPVPLTLVKGNHDGKIEPILRSHDQDLSVTPADGTVIGEGDQTVGFAHGHTWPGEAVLGASTVCIGHEHPMVRLADTVGGCRTERAWLRGELDPVPFRAHHNTDRDFEGDIVVFPAFNDISGGTWVNVDDQEFLSPFLPDGLGGGEAYLLDGTRLGPYDTV